MRLLILKSTLWAFSCLSIWLVIEYYAGKEINDYRRKLEILNRRNAGALILGSSHSFYGVLADESSGTYNMSWSSQTLDETGWIAEQVPDSIHLLVCISPFSLSTTVDDRVERWRNVLFNRTFTHISSDFHELSFLLSMGGRKTLRMAKNGFNGVGPSRIDEYGNGIRDSQVKDFKGSAQAAHKRHFVRPNHDGLKRKLIRLSRRPNTSFFTPPFHRSYQTLIANEPNWSATLSLLDSLSRNYQVNYSNYSGWDTPDSCFYDADHLNKHGQRQFSRTLLNTCTSTNTPDLDALQQR